MTREIYKGIDGYLYAVHSNGSVYATFSGSNQALAYWKGLDAKGREYFHIEDEDGNEVIIKDQPHYPGHAYSVLASLQAHEAASGK